MLGIVVMVTGIVTAIVLSFKYVSAEDRGAVGCYGYSWLGIPGAGAGRREVWVVPFLGSRVRYQPWKAACLQGEGGISSSSSRAGCGQDLPCLAYCLPAPRLTLLISPPAQVPWLHMLYAAIGAIAFTLVS